MNLIPEDAPIGNCYVGSFDKLPALKDGFKWVEVTIPGDLEQHWLVALDIRWENWNDIRKGTT